MPDLIWMFEDFLHVRVLPCFEKLNRLDVGLCDGYPAPNGKLSDCATLSTGRAYCMTAAACDKACLTGQLHVQPHV
jgi:hypothetical protein